MENVNFLKRSMFDLKFYDKDGNEIGQKINENLSQLVDLDLIDRKSMIVRLLATPKSLDDFEKLPSYFKAVLTLKGKHGEDAYSLTFNNTYVSRTEIHRAEDNAILMLDIWLAEEIPND